MIDYRRATVRTCSDSAKSPTLEKTGQARRVVEYGVVGNFDTFKLTHGVERDLRMMFDALMAFASEDE